MHTDSKISAYLKSTGLLLDDKLDNLQIELLNENVTIGRDKSNDISIKVRTVSNQHAKITHQEDRWFIEDLQSKNGTLINEYKIKSNQELNGGDTVSIGGVAFSFRLNKPEVLLRQDSITSELDKQMLDQGEQFQGIDQTMHFNSADLASALKQTTYQKIKREISDLIRFNLKTVILLLALTILVGYGFFKVGMILRGFLF